MAKKNIQDKLNQIKALSYAIGEICYAGSSVKFIGEEIAVLSGMVFDLADDVEDWYLNLEEYQGKSQGQAVID
jgi:hypothetical protein